MGETKKEAAASSGERRAAFDVGTNSVKLLVGDVADSRVAPVHEESKQTRLGAGFYRHHRLQPEPPSPTRRRPWPNLRTRPGNSGAVSINVIGTSATRERSNAGELIDAIRSSPALSWTVLSGEQEADWVFAA